jgi:hypothetical protein
MKKLLLSLITVSLSFGSMNAQQSVELANTGITRIEVLGEQDGVVVLKATMGELRQQQVSTPQGTALIPVLGKGTPLLERGFPDLPKLTASVIIPDHGTSAVEVVDARYVDYQDVSVAPSKGNLYRNIDPATIPYTYAPAYQQDAFFPATPAAVRSPFILRDHRGLTVVFHPVQYNPVTRVLRVYQDITVEVRTTGSGGINTLERADDPTRIPSEFLHTYDRHFLNHGADGSRYTPVSDEGKLLIVCHPAYVQQMAPFVAWKKQKGIATELVTFASVGTTAQQLKDFVANYYASNELTFLLIVGDFEHIPAFETSYGFSDNAFGYILGDDAYPEVIVGRFSAETQGQVTTMVNRTLAYEKFAQTDNGNGGAGWYARAMGIASEEGDGYGHNGLIDYEHSRIIGEKLMSFTYTSYAEMYEGSQGGTDAPEHPTYQMVAQAVDQGLSFVNYTGHGSMNQCGTSGFSNTDADNLVNVGKYPFWVAVACQNGVFFGGTCIAESMARAEHNGQPAGSIGFYGATINQSWAPPMSGQMEMTDILTRSYADNIQRSIGGIGVNGIMKTLDDYGDGGVDIMDTWVLFGDPTAYMRTANPATLAVNHAMSTPLVTQQIAFSSPTPDAFVALTVNGEIIGTGYMVGGSVTIDIAPLTSLDPIVVTGTAFNHTSYLGDIAVVPAEGPFVSSNVHVVNDLLANNNQMLDYNEAALLNVSLANLGLSTANGVEATLSTSSPYITITDNHHVWGDITNGNALLQSGAYAVQVADDVPDQQVAVFTLTITDTDGNTWTSSFSLLVNAPVLSCGSFDIDDSAGNGNGRLESGETATLRFELSNTGHADANEILAQLNNVGAYLNMLDPNVQLSQLNAGQSLVVQMVVTVADQIPAGSTVSLEFEAQTGVYATDCSFNEAFNLVIEDWESNAFDQHEWSSYGAAEWFTTDQQPYEGSYCSQSGAVGDGMSTMLELTIDSILEGQTISFARKVSCEEGWDFLRFHMDGALMGEWTGELAWDVVSYPVSAGEHTFLWEYFKDAECCTGGADAAWIDEVVLPQTEQTFVHTSISEISTATGLNVFPNPTNGQASIRFSLPKEGPVRLELFDTQGRSVHVLHDGRMAGGTHTITTDVRMAAGIYPVRLTTAGGVDRTRIVVVE